MGLEDQAVDVKMVAQHPLQLFSVMAEVPLLQLLWEVLKEEGVIVVATLGGVMDVCMCG